MKVGIVTTWGVKCGHAELAENLVENLPHVEFIPITNMTNEGMLEQVDNVDIFHISWGHGFSHMTADGIHAIHAKGKKVVLLDYTTKPDDPINSAPIFDVVDKLISTEKVFDHRFEFMPHGIPDNWIATQEPEHLVGTIGFPLAWKGLSLLAHAANEAGLTLLGILPDLPSAIDQGRAARAEIQQIQPNAILFEQWLTREEVKLQLGRCAVQLFAHNPPPGLQTYGVSSACRYGIATGRPCVFNQYEMYRDLFDYEDELYFTSNDVASLAATLKQAILPDAKRPNRILKEASWHKCALRYEEIYKELI